MLHRRVIVAEDDAEMRWLVSRALRRDGWDVIELADGDGLHEALIARLTPDGMADIDLVVTDVRMPGRSGLEVVETIRDAAYRGPIILMTAFGDDEIKARAWAAGAVFFDKPFDLEHLRVAARELLRRQSA